MATKDLTKQNRLLLHDHLTYTKTAYRRFYALWVVQDSNLRPLA